jgi:hypothetical protein
MRDICVLTDCRKVRLPIYIEHRKFLNRLLKYVPFELQALSSSQTEAVFNYLLPDNDGVDDFLKSLDIPAQETYSNVPISKSMCQFLDVR